MLIEEATYNNAGDDNVNAVLKNLHHEEETEEEQEKVTVIHIATIDQFALSILVTGVRLVKDTRKGNTPEDSPTKVQSDEKEAQQYDSAVVFDGRTSRHKICTREWNTLPDGPCVADSNKKEEHSDYTREPLSVDERHDGPKAREHHHEY